VWSNTGKKKARVVEIVGESWTCDHCQNVVAAAKTRCGKCHRWKGGKRQGGWKLGSGANATADNVDRASDWNCCGQPLPATQSRCGKCNKWRGGKRKASKPGEGEDDAKKLKADEGAGIEPAAVVPPILPDVNMADDNEVVVDVAEEVTTV
jgi:hypothetical protein